MKIASLPLMQSIIGVIDMYIAMYKAVVFCMLVLTAMTGLAQSSPVGNGDESSLKIVVSVQDGKVDVRISNSGRSDIVISPNLRYLHNIHIDLLSNIDSKRPLIRSMLDIEPDIDNIGILSPRSFVGTIIYFSEIADRYYLREPCYDAVVSYTYWYSRDTHDAKVVKSDAFDLCFASPPKH